MYETNLIWRGLPITFFCVFDWTSCERSERGGARSSSSQKTPKNVMGRPRQIKFVSVKKLRRSWIDFLLLFTDKGTVSWYEHPVLPPHSSSSSLLSHRCSPLLFWTHLTHSLSPLSSLTFPSFLPTHCSFCPITNIFYHC